MKTSELESIANFNRATIIGPSGSGKTTFAAGLNEITGIQVYSLDEMLFDEGSSVDEATFRSRIWQMASQERWIADGSYSSHRDIHWRNADAITWLDPPAITVASRLAIRTWERLMDDPESSELPANDLRAAFLSRDSYFFRQMRKRKSNRDLYEHYTQEMSDSGISVIRLTSTGQVRNALRAVRDYRNNDD